MKSIFAAGLFVATLCALPFTVFAQSDSRAELLKQIETKRAELAILEKQILEPSEQDQMTYAEFLRQPHTGLIRLLPREKYDGQTYKDKTTASVTITGGGAYYSFTQLSHDYNSGAPDISLEAGKLSVGFAGANYGMLTSLGDAPLEAVSMEHPGMPFISGYLTPNDEAEARAEVRRFGQGVTIDGTRYQGRLPMTVNTTYILRSINYLMSDVLVTFKVVRQDTDGSIIILWKLLKKYPTPKLARNN